MTSNLLTFHPHQTIWTAMQALLKHGVSGGPVIDDDQMLIGVLSELDCLKMLASEDFYSEEQEESTHVAQYMSVGGRTIAPELGIYGISHYFVIESVRRLPVVEKGRLIGQVSRRDVLRGMEEMNRKRLVRRRYPDYVQPA